MLVLLLIATVQLLAVPLETHWSGLESVIVGHEIRVVLPDSQVLQGKALRVEADALVMEVRKTSNTKLYPKVASYSVPRSALKTLQLRQKTYHWRIIGTAVGAVGSLAFIGALAASTVGGLEGEAGGPPTL